MKAGLRSPCSFAPSYPIYTMSQSFQNAEAFMSPFRHLRFAASEAKCPALGLPLPTLAAYLAGRSLEPAPWPKCGRCWTPGWRPGQPALLPQLWPWHGLSCGENMAGDLGSCQRTGRQPFFPNPQRDTVGTAFFREGQGWRTYGTHAAVGTQSPQCWHAAPQSSQQSSIR